MKYIRTVILGLCLAFASGIAVAGNCQTNLANGIYFAPEMTTEVVPNLVLNGACLNVSNADLQGSFNIFASFLGAGEQYSLSCSCMSKGKQGKLKPDASKRFTCVGEELGGEKLLTMNGKIAGPEGDPKFEKLRIQVSNGVTGILSNARKPLGPECM